MDWFEKGKQHVKSHQTALAADLFDKFTTADTLDAILMHFRHLTKLIQLQPTHFPLFISRLKENLLSVQNQAFLGKYEEKVKHTPYLNSTPCQGLRVIVVGGGPCGLRTAIEAQFLGAQVTVIEKRVTFSRNNVLHLWPFVIVDLKGLGAKTFYPKFCAGAIDHIAITQLQLMLLKVALIVGVEFVEGLELLGLEEPSPDGGSGWGLRLSKPEHPLAQTQVDVVIGASGRGGGALVDGFQRRELRGKLAIAITANFVNHRTQAEARVEEISGVSAIYKQNSFDKLARTRGIDLENIVYYKDHTHYFVMTVKKQSLLWKGVLKENYAEADELVAKENVDMDALLGFILEAVDYWTESKLRDLEFASNHRGEPDVALFDFTAMYQAQNACQVLERHGRKLLVALVGDSLLEPFWPTGTGIARGFLSALDACWMMRSWGRGGGSGPLEVMAERESIYRLLAQTTTENLKKSHDKYSVDPSSRYASWNPYLVSCDQVKCLYRTDAPPPPQPQGQDEGSEVKPREKPRPKPTPTPEPIRKPTPKQPTPRPSPKPTPEPIRKAGPKPGPVSAQKPPWVKPRTEPGRTPGPGPGPAPLAKCVSEQRVGVGVMEKGPEVELENNKWDEVESGRDSSDSPSPLWNSTCYVSSRTYNQEPAPEGEEREMERKVNRLARSLTLPSHVSHCPLSGLGERGERTSVRTGRVQGLVKQLKDSKSGVFPQELESQFQSPYKQELNELREKREEYAEKSKREALARIRALRERRELMEEEKKERTIRRLECPQLPTSSLPPATASSRTSDEFFDPYKMRLYRKTVPSIGERSEKLADKLFNTGLKKKASETDCSRKGLWRDESLGTKYSYGSGGVSPSVSTSLSKSNSDSDQSNSSSRNSEFEEEEREERRRREREEEEQRRREEVERKERRRREREEEQRRREEMERERRERERARKEELERLRRERESQRKAEEVEMKRTESILEELDEDAIEDLLNWSEDAL